jgi:hypothetical protein
MTIVFTKGSADSKKNCVVVHFLHAVVLEQDTRVSVHIGPGVLHLSSFCQNWWDEHVQLRDELEHLVVGQVLEGELTLTSVTRISLA